MATDDPFMASQDSEGSGNGRKVGPGLPSRLHAATRLKTSHMTSASTKAGPRGKARNENISWLPFSPSCWAYEV